MVILSQHSNPILNRVGFFVARARTRKCRRLQEETGSIPTLKINYRVKMCSTPGSEPASPGKKNS
jgi:hypothetical protein